MLYVLYTILTSLAFILLLPFSPLVLLSEKYRYRFWQRLAWYPARSWPSSAPLLWLHAASVGEAQALPPLIAALRERVPGCGFVISTTTAQGLQVAKHRLPRDIICLLAPLDVCWLVRLALRRLRPDAYICLETELWPAMLRETRRTGIPLCLLNGRLSDRSVERYRRFAAPLAREILGSFSRIAVVTDEDYKRFLILGADPAHIAVCGNAKFDFGPPDRDKRRQMRDLLVLDQEPLFIAGSTRSGEEEFLLPVYRLLLREQPDLVWLIAPRHLERLGQIRKLLGDQGLPCCLLSALRKGERQREQIILVDSMGDLSDLYAAGDHVFCGGSLVDKGGHNVMEIVRWGIPVHFGPSMRDFQDVADLLVARGAGFQAADSPELGQLLLEHLRHPATYALACRRAAEVAEEQRGAAVRQAALAASILDAPGAR